MNWKQKLGIKLGNLYFNYFSLPEKYIPESKVKRIVFFGLPGLGDCLMLTPGIHRYKELYPDRHITVFAYPHTIPLFEFNPHIDEVIMNKGKNLAGVLEMRKHGFDKAIMLEMFTTPVFAYLSNIPIRRGNCKNENGFALTTRFCERNSETCITWANKIIGVDDKYTMPEVYGVGEMNRYKNKILLFPDAGTNDSAKKKRWELDKWIELINKLGPENCIVRGLSGSKGSLIEEKCPGVDNQMNPLIGIMDTLHLINSCKLVVTHDSFPLHAAATFNKPTVVIFGPTDPVFLAPYPNAHIIQHKLPCHSCFYTDRVDICNTQECLRRITVDEVYTRIQGLLNNNI